MKLIRLLSLKSKLIIILLIVGIIPMGIVSLFGLSNIKNVVVDAGTNRINGLSGLEAIANLELDRVNSYLVARRSDMEMERTRAGTVDAVQTLARYANDGSNPIRLAAADKLHTQMGYLLSAYNYKDVLLVDPSNSVMYIQDKTDQLAELGQPLYDPTDSVFTEGKKGVYISQIMPDRATATDFQMLVSGPVKDANGTVLAVLVFELDANDLFKLVQNHSGLGDTGEVLLGARTDSGASGGAVFITPLRFDPGMVLKMNVKFGDVNATPMQNAVQEGKDGAGPAVDYRGVPVYAAWRNIPSMRWGLVAKMDQSEMFAPLNQLQNEVYLLLVVIVGLVVLFSIFVSRQIINPINKITRVIDDISHGKFDVAVEGTDSNDEIGDLARAFDRTLVSLKLAMRKKSEMNAVQDRGTADDNPVE